MEPGKSPLASDKTNAKRKRLDSAPPAEVSPSSQITKPVENKTVISPDDNCEPGSAFLPNIPPEVLLEIIRHVPFLGGQPPVVRGRPVPQPDYDRSHAQNTLSLQLASKQMNEMASFLMQKAFDSEVTLHIVLGSETSEKLCRRFLAKNGLRGWVRRLRINIEVKSIKTLCSVANSCALPRPRLRVGPALKQMVTNRRLKEFKIVMGPDPKRFFDSWPLTLEGFLQNGLGLRLMLAFRVGPGVASHPDGIKGSHSHAVFAVITQQSPADAARDPAEKRSRSRRSP